MCKTCVNVGPRKWSNLPSNFIAEDCCSWSECSEVNEELDRRSRCAGIMVRKAKKMLTGYSKFYFQTLIRVYIKIRFNKLKMPFGVHQPQLCGCASRKH
jgi:hypothetical protein